jgi:hypothetical protein
MYLEQLVGREKYLISSFNCNVREGMEIISQNLSYDGSIAAIC